MRRDCQVQVGIERVTQRTKWAESRTKVGDCRRYVVVGSSSGVLGNKLPYSRLSVCDIGHTGGSHCTRRYLSIINAGCNGVTCDSFMQLSWYRCFYLSLFQPCTSVRYRPGFLTELITHMQ